ncbi:hypothetical protein PVAP13_3KG467800 [Panicum virgatum]|uniref:DUF4220 domain-containing protein n=1 Tax=Panicum virgatum TaxID=38727 RepID=A0A8T0UYP3_PANVG|nr:hypothetical protein PVAP13_3KG467800 [Panicum virgatum]
MFENVICDQSTRQFVSNLTSTYVNESNEASMVAASVIMFVLAGVFFNLNLFSGISDVSAILDPKKVDEIRMKGISSSLQRAGRVAWLGSLVFFNVRSAGRKIIFGVLWIISATTVLQRIAFTEFGKRSYAHGKNARLVASYMAWILGPGGQPGAAAAQNAAATSQAGAPAEEHAGVPVVVHHHHDGDHDVERAAAAQRRMPDEQLLKTCRYIVVGEDQLVKEATADGYDLNVGKNGVVAAPGFVTVGDVWSLAESDPTLANWDQDQRLRRLCLSFALFKLLRRRFEQHEPLTEEEAAHGRELILKGLYYTKVNKVDGHGGTAATDSAAVFQVINDDVNFLSEYYHSVVPVIFASPFFLLANYLLLPVVVLGLCLMVVFLCGNGDLRYAMASIHDDNYTLNTGISNLTLCLLKEVAKNPPNSFFALLDLSITLLLFVIFVYESVWELAVFLLSNWFMVALVCDYTGRPAWRGKPGFRWAFRQVRWLRSRMSHGELTIKQFSVLNLRWPPAFPLPSTLSLLVRARTVPACVKDAIMEYLVEHGGGRAAPISIGKPVLADKVEEAGGGNPFSDLGWAFPFKSTSIAEIILTWHIATTMFGDKFLSSPSPAAASASSIVATRLSRYCAYLVMFHPELLPDNPDKTEDVVERMKKELKEGLGCLEFFFFRKAARVERIMKLRGEGTWTEKKVVKNGVTLGASLQEKAVAAAGHPERVWRMLADVWTELIVYLAPSTDEERMKGHEDALMQGGEFITVLWALTTHTGISRQPMPGAGQGGDGDRAGRAAASPGSGH